MKIVCAHCGKRIDKPTGEITRARNAGLHLYCGRRCSGLGRRKHIPRSVLRLKKKLYDAEYRKKNLALLKAKKHAHHLRTYDPIKAAIERKKKMPRHVEYCRRPEYKRWKSKYDRRYRAVRNYGPFAEVAMLTTDLNREIKGRMTTYDIKRQNDTTNKVQFRRRGAKEKERSRPRTRDRRRDHSAAHG